MDTVRPLRIGHILGKRHHDILISLVVIRHRTRQGEAHTANDGVFRAALDLYTLVSLSNVPRGHVLLLP
jgi:hypothetical protein